MRRSLIGILGLFGVVAGLFVGGFEYNPMLGWAMLRVGIVLLGWWAAYDQLQRLGRAFPLWIGGGLAFLVVVLLVFPRSIYVVGPLIALLGAIGCFWWMAKAPFRKKGKPAKAKAVRAKGKTKRVERDDRQAE